jgi:hypothetical protein
MRQRLIVIRDGLPLDGNAERARDLECVVALRQLPQPTEQAIGRASPEHDGLAVAHPQRFAREHAQLVLLLARRGLRQLGLPAGAVRDASSRERAHETSR